MVNREVYGAQFIRKLTLEGSTCIGNTQTMIQMEHATSLNMSHKQSYQFDQLFYEHFTILDSGLLKAL